MWETFLVMQYNTLENRKCFLAIPMIESANAIKITQGDATLKYSSERGFMLLTYEIESLGLKDQRTYSCQTCINPCCIY